MSVETHEPTSYPHNECGALVPYHILLIPPVHTCIYTNIYIYIYHIYIYIHIYIHTCICIHIHWCIHTYIYIYIHIYTYINIHTNMNTHTGEHKGVYSRRSFDLNWSTHGHFSRFYLRWVSSRSPRRRWICCIVSVHFLQYASPVTTYIE